MRNANSWNRDDSLAVLASYLDRPRTMTIPPRPERERVANLLRHDVEEVTRHFAMYADLAAGRQADERETKLWTQYASDPLECAMAVDEWLASRRQVPYHLRKRIQ